ncbi:MAG: type II toxin-antitoxin system HicB family antitoxin [Oscillospiraceae bacterium]|nr:type II toxin-antitoxin system HicB family antitoxin [Oscillospiraceae bacterium]
MYKDFYSYIAVVSFDEDGISIDFPDLPGCFTCADNEDEIFAMAKEVLGLHLWGLETDNELIPEPSPLRDIKTDSNESTMLIEVFMPPIRDRQNNKVINKTLTIPQWLNWEAEHAGVNFSQLFQNALKEYLHIPGGQR